MRESAPLGRQFYDNANDRRQNSDVYPERLGDALNELGQIACEAGRVIDIALYGGSCLMLASNFRIATADVDAVAAEDPGQRVEVNVAAVPVSPGDIEGPTMRACGGA